MNIYFRSFGCALLAAMAAFPGVASAAEVSVQTDAMDQSTLSYRARWLELNHLYIQQQDVASVPVRDLASPLRPGRGCTLPPVVCSAPFGATLALVSAQLSDRNDIGWIDVGPPSVDLRGGSGADDLLALSLQGSADVHGGNGADTIRSAAHRGGTLSGGAGADAIHAGPSDTPTTVDAGTGDDLVAARRNVTSISGGDGDDRLIGGLGFIIDNSPTTIDGGTGDDVIAFASTNLDGTWTLRGGSGNDVIQGSAMSDTVSGDGGADRIDVVGNGIDTVSCGAGRDIVWADPDDVVDGTCERVLAGPADLPEVSAAVAAAQTLASRTYTFPA